MIKTGWALTKPARTFGEGFCFSLFMELTKSLHSLLSRVYSRSQRRRKRAASLLRSSYSNCNLCCSVQNRIESEANNGHTAASDDRDATGHDPAGESRLLEPSLPYSIRRNSPRSSQLVSPNQPILSLFLVVIASLLLFVG